VLDEATVPTSRRVLAALGPRMLQLAAQRSAGAHPYLTTPQHTGQARNRIGPSVFLAPEHKVVLDTDAAAAREIGRQTIGFYLRLRNYVNNWKQDRKSTRLNSSHVKISYAVFCLKKKKKNPVTKSES